MVRKVKFMCAGCKQDRYTFPPVLWTEPVSDVLKLRVHDENCPVDAVFEGRLLSFCNTRCMKAYFAKHIRSKTDVDTKR